jgi:hypothetical protein
MIIICEPQCVGFEHVEVNAALIAAMRYAHPQEGILFLAEKEHLELVSGKLEDQSVKIQSREIGVPPRFLSNFRRLPRELLLCKNVFDIARNNAASKVLFISITSPTLISIKVLLRFFNEIECIVIPHNVLNTITRRPSFVPIETLFYFRFWLSFGNMKRLRYLVLSPYIKERLSILLPKIGEYARSVDLPYFFDAEKGSRRFNPDLIRFGALGVASRSKGTDIFFAMAKEILHSHTPSVPEFVVVGHITDKTIEALKQDSVIVESSDLPLSREDFETRAKSVDYVLFLNRPDAYDLAMSGSLMDAFSYLRPIIALKQPLFEYYFKAMGDIGYLCESYEEIKEQILSILANKPDERYMVQQCNILNGREQFSPMAVSSQLATLWNCETVTGTGFSATRFKRNV